MSRIYSYDHLTIDYFGPREQPPAELALWVDVVKLWWKHHRAYLDQAKEAGWAYRERPNVGFLASAIWGVGGVALEEYEDNKKDPSDKRFYYTGRGDLWAKLGKRGYKLEAKHKHVNLQTHGTEKTLCSAADAAGLDSDHLRFDSDYTGGIAFLSLWLPKERRAEWAELRTTHIRDDDGAVQAQLRKYYNYSFRVDAFDGDAPVDKPSGSAPVGITMLLGLDRR